MGQGPSKTDRRRVRRRRVIRIFARPTRHTVLVFLVRAPHFPYPSCAEGDSNGLRSGQPSGRDPRKVSDGSDAATSVSDSHMAVRSANAVPWVTHATTETGDPTPQAECPVSFWSCFSRAAWGRTWLGTNERTRAQSPRGFRRLQQTGPLHPRNGTAPSPRAVSRGRAGPGLFMGWRDPPTYSRVAAPFSEALGVCGGRGPRDRGGRSAQGAPPLCQRVS